MSKERPSIEDVPDNVIYVDFEYEHERRLRRSFARQLGIELDEESPSHQSRIVKFKTRKLIDIDLLSPEVLFFEGVRFFVEDKDKLAKLFLQRAFQNGVSEAYYYISILDFAEQENNNDRWCNAYQSALFEIMGVFLEEFQKSRESVNVHTITRLLILTKSIKIGVDKGMFGVENYVENFFERRYPEQGLNECNLNEILCIMTHIISEGINDSTNEQILELYKLFISLDLLI